MTLLPPTILKYIGLTKTQWEQELEKELLEVSILPLHKLKINILVVSQPL